MGRMSRYKKIKSCDPFYKGPRRDKNTTCNKSMMKNGKLIEQEMPRAAKDLFRRQLAMKNQTSMKKRSQTKKKQVTPKFQRIPGESKKQYFDRIDHEAAIDVAVSLKESRGMREGRKKHLNERKKKMKEKKRALGENASFDSMKDDVRFGEVVMEPPTLTAKPRKASKTTKGSKPLLLHSLISQKKEADSDTNSQTEKSRDSGLPKSKKRKNMSAAEQEKADKERERAIMAYRLMRKQQLQERNKAM